LYLKFWDGCQLRLTQLSIPLDSTNLNIVHPPIYSIFLALDIHHTWSAAVTQEDVDIVKCGRLLELGHFFPGGDMMCSDQRVMEALHRFLKANYAVVRRQASPHLCHHDLLTSNHASLRHVRLAPRPG
jgi:hypothetical protein